MNRYYSNNKEDNRDNNRKWNCVLKSTCIVVLSRCLTSDFIKRQYKVYKKNGSTFLIIYIRSFHFENFLHIFLSRIHMVFIQ